MTQTGAYSSLREQGEMIGFQYATGEESEPKSMETESFASGVKRKVAPKKVAAGRRVLPKKNTATGKRVLPPKKRTILSDYRKKVAAKKPLVKSVINKKPTSTTQSPTNKPSIGISMGAKIGIGVGILLLLGGVIYVIKKKKK